MRSNVKPYRNMRTRVMGGKVLIVDDVATNRIVMKVKLAAAGYVPILASDGASCLAMARDEQPDLILLDLILPDQPGSAVLQALRADPQTQRIPVVVFSASHAVPDRVEAFRAGADEFLPKPLEDQTLLARIRSLIRARESLSGLLQADSGLPALGLAETARPFQPPGTIALVLARPETALMLRRALTGRTNDRIVAMTPDEALANSLRDGPVPDVFVIDADLALQGGGLRLMSDLRSRTATRSAGFAIYRSENSTVSPAMAFDLGAHDLLSPETAPAELALRLARLLAHKREADRMRASVQDGLRLAVIDPLTGLHNRRYGLAYLQAMAERAAARGMAFAVLVADIDRFKSINDRHGHGAGDAVLIEVASRLRAHLRTGDLIARIGGEEFLIALPDISLPDARSIAERLCSAVAEQPFDTAKAAAPIGVTISIGLAVSEAGETPAHFETVTDLFDRADRALMRSKAAGRNQVTVSRRAA